MTASMPIRANISRVYLTRLAIVTVFAFGFTGWCLYDGMVAWPNQRERALAWEELQELSVSERREKWNALVEENDWPRMDPGPAKTEGEIQGQFAMAALPVPFGVIFFFLLLRNRGRWIEATNKGLTSNRGDDFTFEQIVEFNKRQWKKKGIARIFYDDNGRRRKLVLDDCNYERKPTVQILRLVEDNISHDKITNGTPEPPPEEEGESQEVEGDES